MLLKIVVVVVVVLWCILGAVMAITNAIRADPPFTIIEKREKIDAEARKRIQEMIDNMDKN
ncbi:MAG: hypothetical protein HDP34_00850 [Clostridia bacterium]|nr:hypothetical protein [Clostridia bacterium]